MNCDPDAPLGASEARLRATIENGPLATPDQAGDLEFEDDLWHPSMGKRLAFGSLELAVWVSYSELATDHACHWTMDYACWAATNEQIPFDPPMLRGDPLDEMDSIADHLIRCLAHDLVEGESYVLALSVETFHSSGRHRFRFTFDRERWPDHE